jgi:hypothetical protein
MMKRGLKREEAAELAGVSAPTFDKYVKVGIYPHPTVPGRRWDRKKLEQTMDNLSHVGAASDPYEQWKRGKRHEA